MNGPVVLSRFLDRPVPKFIHIAVSRHGSAPLSSRGYAALFDGKQLWIYMLRSEWLRLNEHLQDRSMLAALLTSGIDNESYQVKGTLGGCRSLEQADMAAMERERELIRHTFPGLFAVVAVSPADCVAVAIRNSAVYIQTPGPLAGSPIMERSP